MQITDKEETKAYLNFQKVFYYALPFLILISLIPIFMSEELFPFFSHLIILITIFIALVLSILSTKNHKNIEFKETTLFISLFLFFFLLREIFLFGFYLSPKHSIIRLFIFLVYFPMWALAYIPLYYLGIKTTMKYYEYIRTKNLIFIFIINFVIITIYIFTLMYIPITSPFILEKSILDKIILLLYPLLNLGLVILLLFIMNIYNSGFMSEYWLFITIGITMFTIGNIIDVYNVSYGIYFLGGFVYPFYIFSYLIFIIGFLWVYISKTELIKIMPHGKYDIKEIFLIHNNGIALYSKKVENTTVKIDEQMVTSMLTAIQEFVKTSFNVKGTELKEIYYGNFVMTIENGRYISLALISLGKITKQFRNEIIRVIGTIEERFLYELKNFDGDITKFKNTEEYLQDLVA